MKNVIFDLDLTLLDTLDDLKEAMNYVLRTFGFPERTKTEINSFIGNGIRKLITRSLPTGSSEELIEKSVLLFRTYYKEHMMVYTKPYEGIIDMLMELKQHGFKLGVASNKDDFAVNILCDKYFKGIFDGISGSSDIIKTNGYKNEIPANFILAGIFLFQYPIPLNRPFCLYLHLSLR